MAFYEKNNQYSPKGYCYYACVIGYALYAERGKAVMKKTNEVSKLVGVSRRTLQYYDNEGLLDVKRSKNNYRLYDENALERIWKIMLYKEMGFNLKEIHELLLLSENEQKDYLKGHMQKIEEEINALQDQIDFILMIIEQEMPNVSEDDSGTTYVQRIRELKNKVKYGGQKYDRKYYIEGIRKLRYRLDEAYQQLQQGHFTELVDGMRPEFKEAMDSYEAFYEEYCDFMKAYNENSSDVKLIAKYAKMLKKAQDVDEKFEEWEDGDLNDAELKYYIEVQGRVSQKLLEVADN